MKKNYVKKENSYVFIDILGWYGVVAILGAYASLSFGFLSSSSLIYQILNLTGAFGILYEAWTKRDYEPAVLNLIWAVIALIALLRMFI